MANDGMKWLGIAAAAVGAWWTLRGTSKESGEDVQIVDLKGTTLDDLYKEAAHRYGVEWQLLKALAIVESSERPGVKNPADPSYGLMQILCIPDGNGGCKNNLNVMGWPPENVEQLYDPEYSIKIGAQIIRWNQDTYGWLRGIAVYNHWGARKAPKFGPFPNQDYVDKVVKEYSALKHSNMNVRI